MFVSTQLTCLHLLELVFTLACIFYFPLKQNHSTRSPNLFKILSERNAFCLISVALQNRDSILIVSINGVQNFRPDLLISYCNSSRTNTFFCISIVPYISSLDTNLQSQLGRWAQSCPLRVQQVFIHITYHKVLCSSVNRL